MWAGWLKSLPNGGILTINGAISIGNNVTLNSVTDAQNLKTFLVSSITENLRSNVTTLRQIFESMTNRFTFTIFKRLVAQTIVGTYEKIGGFTNLSLLSADIANINDNFSNFYTFIQINNTVNYFGEFLQQTINQFQINNILILQQDAYQDYFNSDTLTLWNRLDLNLIYTQFPNIIDPSFVTINQADPTKLKNIFILDFIPLLVLSDIESALNTYAQTNSNSSTFNTNLATSLATVKNTIISQIGQNSQSTLFISSNDLTNLSSLSIAYKSPDDILFVALLRPELKFSISNGTQIVSLMAYIQNQYNIALTFTINTYLTGTDSITLNVIANLNGIFKSFFTVETDIPQYTIYKNKNNYRVYQTTPLVTTQNVPIFDTASSIWFNIQNTFETSVNNLFNNSILNLEYYTNNLGLELTRYLNDIVYSQSSIIPQKYKIYSQNLLVLQYVDYYTFISDTIFNNTTTINPDIFNYIDDKLVQYNYYLNNYTDSKLLLNTKDITLNQSIFYYNQSELVLNALSNIILTDPLYGVVQILNSSTPSVALKDKIQEIANNSVLLITVQGAMDVIGAEEGDINNQGLFNVGVTSGVSPYTSGSNLDFWYFQYIFPFGGDTLLINAELAKFNLVVGNLSPATLYLDIANIALNYNNFHTDIDTYAYLTNLLINKSMFKDLLLLKVLPASNNSVDIQHAINTTYLNILAYFNNTINTTTTSINLINNLDPINNSQLTESKLLTVIKNLNNEAKALFGWIPNLGQFLIDTISVEIGGQRITRDTGEFLYVNNELLRCIEKDRGYNIMIGNTKDLYTYDNLFKKGRRLYIPLQFWFCKYRNAAIPLISLQYTDVMIKVKLKKISDVIRNSIGAVFTQKIKVKCAILAEYIYVENDERKRLAETKHEQLIETMDTSGDLIYGKNDIEIGNQITTRLFFSGPCKELIWMVQVIDPTTNNTSNYTYKLRNPIFDTKIQFNGRDREATKISSYYNNVLTYEYHSATPPVGIHCYSFGLNPELQQPTGSVNLSKIDNFSIIITLDSELANDILLNGNLIRFVIYARKYNILRIASGLSGLLFNDIH